MAEAARDGAQYVQSLGDDFGTDAIAREHRDVRLHGAILLS
jgi:hypothetical protein